MTCKRKDNKRLIRDEIQEYVLHKQMLCCEREKSRTNRGFFSFVRQYEMGYFHVCNQFFCVLIDTKRKSIYGSE